MRTSLALSFASVVILAFASGCSDEATQDQTGAGDVAETPAPATGSNEATKKDEAATQNAAALTIVRGKFAEPSAAALDNARALAITDDQTTYSSYLDGNGEFTLSLPVGASYRIVFVNQLSGGGQVKIGQMSFESGEWFGANVAGEVDLGSVSASGQIESSASDHTDDPSCQMDDGRTSGGINAAASVKLDAINVCMVWESVELHASTDMSDDYADANPDDHTDDARDDDKTCAHWTGANGGVIWGAPWSIEASGQITVAGGFKVEGGISGGFNANAGFGFGFYGGYSGSFTASGFYGGYYGGFSSSYSSSVSGSIGGTVSGSISGGWAISGGFSGGFSGSVSVGGSVSGSVSGKACVTADSCADELSCTAGKCEQH